MKIHDGLIYHRNPRCGVLKFAYDAATQTGKFVFATPVSRIHMRRSTQQIIGS